MSLCSGPHPACVHSSSTDLPDTGMPAERCSRAAPRHLSRASGPGTMRARVRGGLFHRQCSAAGVLMERGEPT